MTSVPLAKSARSELARALDAYERAEFGRLNETADDLQRTCSRLGWRRNPDGPARAWAKAQLETDV